MTPETWERVQQAFERALALDAVARAGFVAQVTADDPEVGRALERMLAADATGDEALQEPIAAGAQQLAQSDEDPWLGKRIGAFTITRRIASGGMGAVFLAARSDRQFEQRVAIKVMAAQMLSPDAVSRFRRERQILASLSHRYIANLIDGGTTDNGLPYLVMEYVVGVPIDRYCDEQRLDLNQRLLLFKKVCEAVDYAHRNLIVHRDLKPSNILVDESGNPRLLDFGIAKLLDDEAGAHAAALTREGIRAMTPEYASPEQVRGEPVSVASDVYSLGTLLYRLLSGRMPFNVSGALGDSLARAILEEEPGRPSDALTLPAGPEEAPRSGAEISACRGTSMARLRAALSGDLDNIVLTALRKDPMRRYPSAVALSEDIDNYLEHRPVNARADSFLYRSSKFVRRNAVALGVAFGIAALTSLSVAQVVTQRNQAELAASQARQVSAFLTRLFESASPFASQGREVSAVDLLEQGSREIEGLSGQPELQAELYRVMGESFSMLGNYERAMPLLERSRELHATLGRADTPAAADTLEALGEALRLAGDLDAAERHTLAALEIREQKLGVPDSVVAYTIGRLGNIQYQRRETETARETLERALAMKRELGEDEDADYADILGNLGITLDSLGEYTAAENALQGAIDLSLQHDGELHPNTIIRISNLGLLQMRQGRVEEAARLFDRCLVASRNVWPPNHPSVARNVRNLAAAQKLRGHFGEALELYSEAVEMARAHSGEGSKIYVQSLRGLGSLQIDLARFEEAEGNIAAALAIADSIDGADGYEAALLRILLGQSAVDQERFAEAEALLRVALQRADRLGASTTLVARRELASALSGLGRTSEADALFAEVIADKERQAGPDSASLVEFLVAAARHDRRKGDLEQALTQARRALEIAGKEMTQGNWIAAQAAAEYGRCLLASGLKNDAGPQLAIAHRELQTAFGDADPRVRELAATLSTL